VVLCYGEQRWRWFCSVLVTFHKTFKLPPSYALYRVVQIIFCSAIWSFCSPSFSRPGYSWRFCLSFSGRAFSGCPFSVAAMYACYRQPARRAMMRSAGLAGLLRYTPADGEYTWRHPQNRKYIAYCIVIRRAPSHVETISLNSECGFEICERTDRQTRSAQYFPPVAGGN